MSERRALVVWHADDADLLNRNLRHHLGLGACAIVVSTIGIDPEADEIVRGFSDDGVFHRVAGEDGEDAFLYFEHAARALFDAISPDWIGFIDTDEFIVTPSGRFETTEATERYGLLAMRRYNAVPQRRGDGRVMPPDLDDPSLTLVAAGEIPIEPAWSSGDTRIPYVEGADLGSKLFVRPRVLDGVASGGHAVRTRLAFVPRCVDRQSVVVHVPFSTPERFERKVRAIRRLLAEYRGRFHPWQWEHWAAMSDEALAEEFERQVFGGERAGRASTTTASTLLARGRGAPPSRAADWLLLSRSVEYEEPVAFPELPAPFAPLASIVDRTTYLARYADLAEVAAHDRSFDPVHHFLTYGVVEGRAPSFEFDPVRVARFLERRLGRAAAARELWWLYFDVPEDERIVPNAWFDPAWFRKCHGSASDWEAFATYRTRVAKDALSPNSWFDEEAYRLAKPEVEAAIKGNALPSGFAHVWATLWANTHDEATPMG